MFYMHMLKRTLKIIHIFYCQSTKSLFTFNIGTKIRRFENIFIYIQWIFMVK